LTLREALLRVLSEYPQARTEAFEKHSLGTLIGRDVSKVVESVLGQRSGVKAKGSRGNGNWAAIPWVATFDPYVTSTAQEGYYPVYLFAEDLTRVSLSLNQGVTAVKNLEGIQIARSTLRSRAILMTSRLRGKFEQRFNTDPISLGQDELADLYEHGHALGVTYDAKSIPEDSLLEADLRLMWRVYQQLREAGGTEELAGPGSADDEEAPTGLQERKRYVTHRSIERQAGLAKKVKKALGVRCQVCRLDFSEQYPGVGDGYIEARHRVPLSELAEGAERHLDIKRDFAVVCANCHRMLHKPNAPPTFEEFAAWYLSTRATEPRS